MAWEEAEAKPGLAILSRSEMESLGAVPVVALVAEVQLPVACPSCASNLAWLALLEAGDRSQKVVSFGIVVLSLEAVVYAVLSGC